jgi:two-component system KDP operon response regulator KdpE
MTMSILVIEDELPMRRVLRTALDAQGYRVWEAGGVQEGLSAIAMRAPQGILLDLGLPDGDGFDVLAQTRENSETPIVVISARGDEKNLVRALDSGANDYVTKPFREAELFARLRAAVRNVARGNPYDETVTLGPLHVQLIERRVFLNGIEVKLTPTEFKVLQVMIRDAGRVLTHKQLLKEVWGPSYVDDVQYLRVFMKQLRQKLEQDPAKPQLLITTPGVGYRFKLPE